MGTIALFNTIYRISTQRTQRDKMRKCEFSLYMSFFTLLSFHLAFKFKVNYFMIQHAVRYKIKFHNLLAQKPNYPTFTPKLPICPLSEFNLLSEMD